MDRIDNQNKETDSDPLRPDFLKKDRKQHAGRALLYYTCAFTLNLSLSPGITCVPD